MSPTPSRPLWQGRALALVGIVLFAFSLRSAVASLSPVLGFIEADFPLEMSGQVAVERVPSDGGEVGHGGHSTGDRRLEWLHQSAG